MWTVIDALQQRTWRHLHITCASCMAFLTRTTLLVDTRLRYSFGPTNRQYYCCTVLWFVCDAANFRFAAACLSQPCLTQVLYELLLHVKLGYLTATHPATFHALPAALPFSPVAESFTNVCVCVFCVHAGAVLCCVVMFSVYDKVQSTEGNCVDVSSCLEIIW